MQAPLALWVVATIAVYTVCLVRLAAIKDPLAALNMAMHVMYRFSHLRMIALMLVTQVGGGVGARESE
jgi:hypothetical protein